MLESKVEKLEERIDYLGNDVVESKQALSSIAKDIHAMSQTSARMENALTKLLETEVKFQLHAQKTEQNHSVHSELISKLFTSVDDLKKCTTSDKVESHTELTKIVADESKEIREIAAQNFKYTLMMVGSLFGLFLSYVAYSDYKFDAVMDKIDEYAPVIITTDADQKAMKVQLRDIYFDIKEVKKDIKDLK